MTQAGFVPAMRFTTVWMYGVGGCGEGRARRRPRGPDGCAQGPCHRRSPPAHRKLDEARRAPAALAQSAAR